ncbi:MAG: cation:proton antiporter [Clostridia bacterium]|nr:cation:proton antiporter [Clostridia bacterium]
METLLVLSVALFAGLMLSRLAKVMQLPAVTAYLVAGIIIGPYLIGRLGISGLGFTSMDEIHTYSLLSDIALGFIAFSIGNEFRLSQLKKTGKQATVIGIFQAVFTTLLVDACLIGLHFLIPDKFPLPAAIILGAIASATAPAATLMVVKQYKAKGPLTDILLPIVALDDAVGLVLFAVSFGIAKAMINNSFDLISMILEPILEVVFSVLLGFVMGLLFSFFEKFFHSRSKRLAMSVTFVLLTVALSMLSFEVPVFGGIHISFSTLLVCMMLGTVFCNVCDFSEELMDRIDRWTAPLFILFFVISGAELEFSIFQDYVIILIGIAYIICRSFGKYFGARVSSASVHCDSNIRKYLGITLLPQAGVALGMALKAQALGEVGIIVANITLFGVLIYELIGPLLTKISLTKAGEIQPEGKVSAREEIRKEMEAKKALSQQNQTK